MKIDYSIPVEPGQKFQIDQFKPEDARGIANLFYTVYGSEYPFETYYIPEKIIEENRNGNVYSVVARTPRGDIIGHGAMYRSIPPYKNLYEFGLYIVLPDYRESFAAYKINKYIGNELIEIVKPDGLFGEAVCNHIITQKGGYIIGTKDVAIEIDLMSGETYKKENNASDRVSCLMLYRSIKDFFQEIFIHPAYEKEIEFIMSDLNIERKINYSVNEIPMDLKTEISVKFFEFAGVGRFNVSAAGSDFETVIANLEEEGRKNNTGVFQYFLNLAPPRAGKSIEILRKKGYFFGGYIPRWFSTDCILMQKNLTIPDFTSINLYSEKAKELLGFIRADWKRAVK
jgi:hypothetical protein